MTDGGTGTKSAARWSDPETAAEILRRFRVWAVVGLSPAPWKPSNSVGRYLISHGYEVIPIYPRPGEVLGLPAYPDLASAAASRPADWPIEVVDIFRRSNRAGQHVDEAIAIGAKAVWMQLGVVEEAAAARAEAAGLLVVMDRCPAIEHPRLRAS
jgi:predicted CoA-binding protein